MKTLPSYLLTEKNAPASGYPFVLLFDVTLIRPSVSQFVGTVNSSGTTITFSSAADAILAGYDVLNPVIGGTLTAGNQYNSLEPVVIESWTNSTSCVVTNAPVIESWVSAMISSVIFQPDNIYIARNTESITFNSNVYIPFPIELDVRKEAGKGAISTVDIKMSNVKRILERTIENIRGAVASTVMITVVNTKYLSVPTDYVDLQMTYDIIQTKTDSKWVYFTLGAPYITRQRFPLYRYLGDFCEWLPYYAKNMECAYPGSLPTCGGTLRDCVLHGNTIDFGGHVGLIDIGLRISR